MSKNKKIKLKKPPLSFLDKCIYSLLVLYGMLPAVYLILMTECTDYIFFKTQNILALEQGMTFMFFMVPCLPLMVSFILILNATYSKRKTFFPKKNVNYGKYSYQFYPIFYKGDKPKTQITKDQKKKFAVKLSLWLVAFIISFAIGSLGICGRTVLTRDGEIIKYTVFNNIKEHYYVSDIDRVEYIAYLSDTSKGPDYYNYGIKVYLKNSDDYFVFGHREFNETKKQSIHTTSLDDMMYLKNSVYKNKKTFYNKEVTLEKIINNNKMTQEEIDKLYKLFNEQQ